MQALGSIPLLLLFTVRDHAWVVLRHPAPDQARYGAALDGINKGILTGRDNPLRLCRSEVALGDGADGSECPSQARDGDAVMAGRMPLWPPCSLRRG